MLELRPNCELCDCDLAPESDQARICAYECTFCTACARDVLKGVCPNCGGNLMARPVRSRNSWRPGTGLAHHPAGTRRRNCKWASQERQAPSDRLKDVPYAQR